jgi:hypothetical protein
MRSQDSAAAFDRAGDDGDEAGLHRPEGSDGERGEQAVDPYVDPETLDEALLEAELADLEEPLEVIEDEEDLDDDAVDPEDDESDDELEIALLQEYGIDLDAPDLVEPQLDLTVRLHDEESHDDEVAA